MKPTKPTDEMIDEEIVKLADMRPNVLMRSAFGDNHHDAIYAQIEVLEGHMDEDEVYKSYPSVEEDEENGYPANVRDAAIEAFNWMEGEEESSPSENWKELVRK